MKLARLLPTRTLRAETILDERIRLESISTAIGSLGVMTIACVMYLIFPHDASNIQYLKVWLSIQLPTGCAWLGFIYFHQRRGTAFTRKLWPYFSTLICSFYGLVWGVGWVYFTNDMDAEHITASVIFTITLGGVFTGGVLATLFHLPSLLSFTLCSLLPPFISSLIHKNIFHIWFGLSLCVYMLACMAFALNLHNFLLDTLEQREEKKKLAQALALEKEQTESIGREKNRLLAAINHDLRQPLQALRCFHQSLQDMPQQTSTAQAIIEDLGSSLDILQNILDSMSELVHTDEHALSLQRQSFPLNILFRRIYQQAKPSAHQRGLQLRYVHTSAYVNSDPAQLERILQNLVTNAIKHMGSSGKILLGARRYGAQVEITVIDNGVGIPLQEQEAVFREYYQLNNPERKRSQGLGLGLATVKNLAHQLDHGLSLWSQEGKGCVFKLSVPLAEPPSLNLPSSAEPNAEPLSLFGKKVLVIEDDEQVLSSLQTLLSLWDCEIITTLEPDPQQILAGHPDLDFIISDYQLSAEQNGIQVIQQLRQLSQRQIPALLMTGNTSPELREQLKSLDIPISYKPINPLQIKKMMMAAN